MEESGVEAQGWEFCGVVRGRDELIWRVVPGGELLWAADSTGRFNTLAITQGSSARIPASCAYRSGTIRA